MPHPPAASCRAPAASLRRPPRRYAPDPVQPTPLSRIPRPPERPSPSACLLAHSFPPAVSVDSYSPLPNSSQPCALVRLPGGRGRDCNAILPPPVSAISVHLPVQSL